MDNYSADIENEKKRYIYNYRKDNYGEDRDRIKINELGSLYLDKDMQKDYRPLIYIGGQMEHQLHRLENATGKTFDPGHYMFDGSWMYEYPNRGTKSNINVFNFADNLVKAIEASGLEEVDIITESYGGLIAACASKSKRIHKVIAIHPPILGTPLASNDFLLDNLNKLERRQKLLARAVTLVVNDYFGFEKDNYLGINNSDILKSIDFNKLTVVGSALDRENDPSWLACSLYDIIYAITGEQSDGVVIYNEETLRKYGINYFTEIAPKNHFAAGSEKNLLRYAHKFFEGWEFVEDEEFDLSDSIPEKDSISLEDKKVKDKKISSENGTLTRKENMLIEDKTTTKGKKVKNTSLRVTTVKDVSLESKTPEFKEVLGNSGEKPNLLDKLFKKFVAENRSKFLDNFYYLDSEEQTYEDGYRSFIKEDLLEKEKELGTEDDGLELLSLDNESGGMASKSDILEICKKVEEERALRLRKFGSKE